MSVSLSAPVSLPDRGVMDSDLLDICTLLTLPARGKKGKKKGKNARRNRQMRQMRHRQTTRQYKPQDDHKTR